MPHISVRGQEMPESPIRKLAPLADDAKKRGVHVYHLNIGQPDLPTPKSALEAIRNIDRTILEYSPSQGYLSYRKKLVGYYASYNINLTPDDIIITSGGSEAVLFSFLACLNPGDEIIVPEPAYANYMAFAISAGARIRTISTTIEEGFSLPKVEKFEELINEHTRAILICNPNNPTGYLYTRREMNQIRDLVKKYDAYGATLAITSLVNGKEDKSEDLTGWAFEKVHEPDIFIAELKLKIEEFLKSNFLVDNIVVNEYIYSFVN
jgi:aspartate aminotransferase